MVIIRFSGTIVDKLINKNNMKKIFYTLLFFLFVSNISSAKSTIKSYPTDTIQKFIDIYGKDSLISLVEDKINLTTQFVYNRRDNIEEQKEIVYLMLVSRKFDLGLDTLMSFNDSNGKIPFTYLYSIGYGKMANQLSQDIANLEEAISLGQYTAKEYIQNIGRLNFDNYYARNSFSNFCNVFGNEMIPILDSFLIYYRSADVFGKFDVMLNFATVAHNCPKLGKYFKESFDENYKKYNLPKIANDTMFYDHIDEYQSFRLPIEVVTYALYSNMYSINDFQADLMYLLNFQNKQDGGWYPYKNGSIKRSDGEMTIFVLWLLCEFREGLLKL